MNDDTGKDPAPVMDARWVASGLRVRVLLPLVLALALLVTGLAAMIVTARERTTEADIARASTVVRSILAERTGHEAHLMMASVEMVMRDERIRAAFLARDRKALQALSRPILDIVSAQNEVTHFYYILPDHTNLLRVHAPDHFGDRIDRFTLREAALSGKPYWGNEQGPFGTFTLRLVYPWMVDGQLAGYVEMGVEFEHIAAEIKEAVDADIFVVVDKKYFDASKWAATQSKLPRPIDWNEFDDIVVLTRTAAVPEALREYLGNPARRRGSDNFQISVADRTAQVQITPFDLRNDRVADLVVVADTTAALSERNLAVRNLVILSALVGGALMLFFHFLLGRVQRDVAQRTARLEEARRVIASEQHERQRAEIALAAEQERNEMLEARSRIVEELAAAKRTAEEALRKNEEVTAKLLETQSELMATAREAGRAEIATNVLHNVGNVLNSVNVSAGVIGGALRNSRVAGLTRAMQLMADHSADLGEFLTRDEKGRMLPGYLHAVADALDKERHAMLEELGRLTKSIDHIKDIVATQQSHAATANVIEPVNPGELADEALRMQGTALARHQVAVVRDYQPMPPMPLDRGRVLQILVNLISNAKAAMASMPQDKPHRLTLRVEITPEALLRFSVRDEGEGIPPENLTRIFSHGFTTRKSGHGFGLHSSALTARQMGGTLTARSDGAGLGATFTLELPMQALEASAEEAAGTAA